MEIGASPSPELSGSHGGIATRTLVERAGRGNTGAREIICDRFRPRLVRWARGRLPTHARGLLDTEDVVQDAILRTLDRLDSIDVSKQGGFLKYLQAAVLNRVRSEVRNSATRNRKLQGLAEEDFDREPSPLDEFVSRDQRERYERGLLQLTPEEQDLVTGRVELQMSYEELAIHVGKPSADAARMACKRAIEKLAQSMRG